MIEILETRVAPATLTWLGSSGGLWSSAVNWLGGATPTSGDTLIFNDSGGTAAMVNDLAGGGAFHLIFAGATHPYSLSGGPVTLLPSGLDDASAAAVEIGCTLTGAGGINQAAGILKLTGINTFTGAVNIGGGVLQAFGSATTVDPLASVLGNPQVPNRAISVGAGATLVFAKSDVFGVDGTVPKVELFIAGTVTNVAGKFNSLGEVHLSAGGVLTGLGGASTTKQMYALTGDITSTGGTISGSGGNAGYHVSDGIIFKPDLMPLVVSAALLNTSPGNSLSPLTPDPTTLVVSGNDAIWLTAANKFSGGVVIQDGTVRIKSNMSLGTAAGEVSIEGGATLAIAPDAAASTLCARIFTLSGEANVLVPTGKTLTLSGIVQDGGSAGTLAVSGGGKVVLGNAGNSFSGGVAVDAAKLRISSNANLGASSGDIALSNGATLEVGATMTTGRGVTLEGLGRFFIPGGKTLTINGVVEDGATAPGSIAVIGGGTLILGNAGNSFSGPYTVSNSAVAVNGVTFKLSGPGTGIVTPLAGGTGIESIAMSGTTLMTSLKVTSSTIGGGPAIPLYHISIPSATDHIKSIDLRSSTILFGDGAADTVPDLFIAGKAKSIGLLDVNPGALIKLGSGLPYDVTADITTPDTYNNHPNITIRDILGTGVRISVLGDGTVAGVGGGGLGKVIVHRWSPVSSTPQPFAPSGGLAGSPPVEYDGVIETTQTIELFEIQEGDSEVDLLVDSNGVGASTKASVKKITCNKGKWNSTGTIIEQDLVSFEAGGFTGSIVAHGKITTFSVTSEFTGKLTAGEFGDVSALQFYIGARITTDTAYGGNGDIASITATGLKNVFGGMNGMIVQSQRNIGKISLNTNMGTMKDSTISAAGNITGKISIGSGMGVTTANLDNSKILSGASLGSDGIVGGVADTWAGGSSIATITILGEMKNSSVIAASIDPGSDGFSGPYGDGVITIVDVDKIGGIIGTVTLSVAALSSPTMTVPNASYTNIVIASSIGGVPSALILYPLNSLLFYAI